VAREPEAPDVVMTNAQHLQQVIVNLVANSIKFSARGEVVVRVRRDGASVAMDVEDQGVGIPAAMHERLFEPFFQVDRALSRRLGGAGLGLALSKRLAQGLGGDLCLLGSREGQGAIFRFTIPLQLPAGDVRGGAERPPAATFVASRPLEALRVLVADDEDVIRDSLCHLLQSAGATVDRAADGEQAVAKALAGDFGIVLMDVRMPVVDGLGAARRLRAAGFSRPIMALTANPTPDQRAACLAAGCDDHVVKPIAGPDLITRIAELARAGGVRP
jgi:CheY-like chemotaxis protein